jgi:hypothetical protein
MVRERERERDPHLTCNRSVVGKFAESRGNGLAHTIPHHEHENRHPIFFPSIIWQLSAFVGSRTYVCTYICMYVCTCVCMYVCMYVLVEQTAQMVTSFSVHAHDDHNSSLSIQKVGAMCIYIRFKPKIFSVFTYIRSTSV